MKKNITILLAMILCILCVFSQAAAFQSPLPGLPQIGSPVNTGAVLTEWSLKLDSLQLYGNNDESTAAVLQMLTGLKIETASQSGNPSRFSFGLSLPDTPILNYSVQHGNPYYISTNFLGDRTYMIFQEDQFEENFVTALYKLIESQPDPSAAASLPPLDDVLEMIRNIRAGDIAIPIPTPQTSIELTREIDTTPLMNAFESLMGNAALAEPSPDIRYTYNDYSPDTLEFSWPDAAELPAISQADSAMIAIISAEDLAKLADALTDFLAANPELNSQLNQVLAQTLLQTQPDMVLQGDEDFMALVLSDLQQTISRDMQSFSLMLKIDQDEYGTPVMMTVELGGKNRGQRYYALFASDENGSAIEISGDTVLFNKHIPMFRSLMNISAAENRSTSFNLNIQDRINSKLEFAMKINTSENMLNSLSNGDVHFFFNGERGDALIFTSKQPNSTNGTVSTTQITYNHTSQGQPVFAIGLTSENKTGDPLPRLTAADAVRASDMSSADYDTLAQTFISRIMMLLMNFM